MQKTKQNKKNPTQNNNRIHNTRPQAKTAPKTKTRNPTEMFQLPLSSPELSWGADVSGRTVSVKPLQAPVVTFNAKLWNVRSCTYTQWIPLNGETIKSSAFAQVSYKGRFCIWVEGIADKFWYLVTAEVRRWWGGSWWVFLCSRRHAKDQSAHGIAVRYERTTGCPLKGGNVMI